MEVKGESASSYSHSLWALDRAEARTHRASSPSAAELGPELLGFPHVKCKMEQGRRANLMIPAVLPSCGLTPRY